MRNCEDILLLVMTIVTIASLVSSSGIPYQPPISLLELQDCGQSDEGVSGDIRQQVPWNVGIYFLDDPNNSSSHRFLLTGTIVGPRTVVSIVGGAYGENPLGSSGSYFIWPPARLLVAAGLKTTSLESGGDERQTSEVAQVLPFPSKAKEFPEYHFLLLQLKSKLEFNGPYVKPSCLVLQVLDGDVNTDIQGYWLRSASGFTYPPLQDGSFPLREFSVSGLPLDDCRATFQELYPGQDPYRPFCARVDQVEEEQDVGVRCLLPGGRVALNGILAALVAIKPGGNGFLSCEKDSLLFFAGILPPLRWIYYNARCGGDGFACNDGSCLSYSNVCDGIPQCPLDLETGIFDDESEVFCKAQNHCRLRTPPLHQCGVGGGCVEEENMC